MDANSAASKAETVASASDDPWLQQITASRQALQSAKVSRAAQAVPAKRRT
ncbi:hypothetical protein PCI56_10950 [Plesiomonas shigelloides subsp. oncorhynchi]|nr:hypothetical protein [Plesiomonas shigelloides]